MKNKIIITLLRIIPAFIMLQTLWFKFSASEESIYIFSTLGMEPSGRIGTGVAELIASILLLIPSVCQIGALMGIGLMSGAIFFHITKLGIEVMNDDGQLFYYALIVLICSLITFFIHSGQFAMFRTKILNR